MRVSFIGAGQMARALASGFVRQGQVAGTDVTASDCHPQALEAFQEAVPQAQVTGDNRTAAAGDIVFISLKPQHLASVMDELRPLKTSSLVVSIVAGVTLGRLTQGLGTERVIRVMPNTPALVGAGASGFCRAPGVSDDDANHVARLLEAVGRCWELPEPLLDAVTGLSGSGPAFVFEMIQALSDGGVSVGLPRPIALDLATQTVLGAAQLVQQTGEHPTVLRDRVASPGGTTIAGLQQLEQGAFRGLLVAAVQAATERSRELGG